MTSMENNTSVDYNTPTHVVAAMVEAGAWKGNLPTGDLLIRGALSGGILGIATSLAIVATVQTGLPIVGALVFPVGFVMIVLLGLELVTGSFALLPIAQIDGKTTFTNVIRNWTWVFLGNLLGSMLYAILLWITLTMMGTGPGGDVGDKMVALTEAKTLAYIPHGGAGLVTA